MGKKKNKPENVTSPPTPPTPTEPMEAELGLEAQAPSPEPIQVEEEQAHPEAEQAETQPLPDDEPQKVREKRTPPPRLSQNELIARAAAEARISTNTAAAFFASLKRVIVEALKDRLVVMLGPDLGNLRLIDTKERQSRNPRTGETVMVPAGVRPRFTPGPILKTYLKTGEWPERQPRRKPAGAGSDVDSPAEAGFKSRRAEKIARRKAEKRAEAQKQPTAPPPEGLVEEQDIDAILEELE